MSCHFHDKKILPYSEEGLYAIVADVKSYPTFLPGCMKAEILEEKEGSLRARLTIGYGIFKETYTSQVIFNPHHIEVFYEEGPFQHLKNYWHFTPLSKNETEVEFFIDFAFRSFLLQRLMDKVFQEGVSHLMEAFERRAKVLLG
jgi:coenzyme Q-binding protein COQ10